MLQFCTECGAATEPGKKFCTGCGAKLEAAEPVLGAAEPVLAAASVYAHQDPQPEPAASAHNYYPPAPSSAPAFRQSSYAAQSTYQQPMPYAGSVPMAKQSAQADAKPIGMLRYLWYLFVMNIPIVGLAMSIVWGVRKGRASSLARAMTVINALWYAAVTYGVMIWYQALKEYHISLNIFGMDITIF